MRRYLDCLKIRQEYRLHLWEDLKKQVHYLSSLAHQKSDIQALQPEKSGPSSADFESLYKNFGRRPNLAVLLWGSDEGGKYFVGKKIEYLRQLGMDGFVRELNDQTHKDELLAICAELASRNDVDAILLQQPADLRPLGYDECLEFISKLQKDVDGSNSELGYYQEWLKKQVSSASIEFYSSETGILSVPAIIMLDLLSRTGITQDALDTSKQIYVLGEDQVTYLPALKFFLSLRANVADITKEAVHDVSFLQKHNISWCRTIEEVMDHQNLLSQASIIVSCLNEPESIDPKVLPNLRCAFDFGYGYLPGTKQIRGDFVKFIPDEINQDLTTTSWITPGIGGVGALISSVLARNLYVNWKRNMKLS